MHKIGNLNTGERKRCRREIDTADEFVTDNTSINLSGPSDDEWNMDATIIEELLASDMCTSVVAHEKDDGIVRESFIIESFEDLPDFPI